MPMSREEAAAHRHGLSAMRRVLDEELWRAAEPLPPASSTAEGIGATEEVRRRGLRRQQEEEAAAAFVPQCQVAPISTRHLGTQTAEIPGARFPLRSMPPAAALR